MLRTPFTAMLGYGPHPAGRHLGGVRRLQPAAEIVRELAEEADTLLSRWGDGQRR